MNLPESNKQKFKIRVTRTITLVIAVFILTTVGVDLYLNLANKGNEVVEGISESLIRFHVIANSDRDADQAVKIKVKDAVVERMQELLKDAETVEESRSIILENMDLFKDLAEEVLMSYGFTETVAVSLQNESFPLKQYGDIILPPGEYEALVIRIGKAEGKNWWCVLFPPLCFVDATHGVVDDVTKEELRNVLTDEEYNAVLSNPDEQKKIKIKLKVLDWLKSKEKEMEND